LQARAHAARALDQLDRDNVLMHGWARASLGFAYMGQGDLTRAAEAFGEAAAAGRSAGNAHAAIMSTLNQTYVQRAQGALHLAVATCRQALAWSAAQGAAPSPIAGVLHLSLAELLREWNDLDAAQHHLTDGIALCAQWGHVDLQLFGPLFQARLLAAQGDLDGALAALHDAKGDTQHQEPLPLSMALLEACEAQLWLAQGNLPAAAAWMRRAEREAAAPRPQLNPLIVVYTYEHLSIAPVQVLLAQGRAAAERAPLRRALALLEQQGREAEPTGMSWRRIKALVLQALAYQALDEQVRAMEALEQALVLAAPEGYVRIFLDEGAPLLALLRQAAAQGIVPGYVSTLLVGGCAPPVPQKV